MRVAALQAELAGSAAGDLPRVIEQCERARVELLVLPECYFGGMPPDKPTAEAVAMSPSYANPISALRDCPPTMTVVAGFTERSADGRLYSSAAVVRDGRLVGEVTRKLFPREPAFSPGEDLPLYHLDDHAFGIVICNDANFVEPARLLALAGARILACPLNNDLPVDVTRGWAVRTRSTLIARAVENDCWVIAADVAGTAGGREGGGATRIIAPDGRVAAAAQAEETGLVMADIEVPGRSFLERWNVAQNPAVLRKWLHLVSGQRGET
ncbi:carbon-nitrogen hydrolase family protein [Nonomuraea sp. NPDC050451]|uniref:carbon-nitrogen hydrolase family protein n=1 Tax=Nonomuraea sp. NPDC050451 TaxID=3364364 RepID=UPI0037920FEE